MASRKCQQCKTPFVVKSNNLTQKYCSRSCLHESRKTKISVVCATCGKTFQVAPSKLKVSKNVYCSRSCCVKSKIGKPPTNKQNTIYKCEECGISFSNPPSAQSRFCGQKCFHAWHKRFMTENPSNPRRQTILVCETCKKEFSIRTKAIENGQGRFCSYECTNVWRRTIKGESHPLKKEYITKICVWCKAEYKRKPSEADKSHFCSRQCVGAWVSSQDFTPTTIEIAIRELLDSLNVAYTEQKPMGKFICDFVVKDSLLAIECDGDYWHSLPQVVERDKRKDSWLANHKYTILRLPEHKIRNDIEWCKQKIINLL